MTTAIHVTHEAVQKFGGIGTVLQGLITTRNYRKLFPRTLLYTPLFHRHVNLSRRLGEDSEVLYSGVDNFDGGNWRKRFAPVEKRYNVQIVYGKKMFYLSGAKKDGVSVDIVAVDIWDIPDEVVNKFKFVLWEAYGIQSDHFQHDRDYEQYLRIAIVLRDVFSALYGGDERAVLFSHEYMGMPSALAFEIDKKMDRHKDDLTVFYAHEVSTARVVVEDHPGHDLAFYNVLNYDRDSGTSLEQEFGSYSHYSRNELVKRATHLNYIFAVSGITKEEYLFLCPNADAGRIKVVYNGIPIEKADFRAKLKSIGLMRDYCHALFNYRPDYIFTHITRLITSKALWRDIRFLYHLDEHFSRHNISGFFIMLSTLVGEGRPSEIIAAMEEEYGWPVSHREGWPDLVGPEIDIYRYLELFNARSRSIKGLFINQFGFGSERCGRRVPSEASVIDLRLASDVEFGLSIYEPFGIAQIENLPYGGVPVVSSACGCARLLRQTMETSDFLEVDFAAVPVEFRSF